PGVARAGDVAAADAPDRPRRGRQLAPRERLDLRGADEVVLRDAAHRVRAEVDAAAVVAHAQVRVVVLAVRDPRYGVYEGDGLVVILEGVGLRDDLAVVAPARDFREERIDARAAERRSPRGEVLAFHLGQGSHASS